MITDEQWAIFAKHVKVNATIAQRVCVDTEAWIWIDQEGFLLENFPYAQDSDRVLDEKLYADYFGLKKITAEGRLDMGYVDELRVQLCEYPDEMTISPHELYFWVKGEFLEFEQVIALGDAQ